MRLVSGRVCHYRSIVDSGLVEFDPEITGIVGAAGSGKTSFLKMLSGVSARVQFGEGDLPHNSEALARFRGGRMRADEIVQLEAVFGVEDADASRLPKKYRHARRITARRRFDGSVALEADGAPVPMANIRKEIDEMKECASRAAGCLPEPGLGSSDEPPSSSIYDAIGSFGETNFYSREDTLLAIRALRTAAHSTPHARPVASKI